MPAKDAKRIDVSGAPIGVGGNHEGSALGPAALRVAGLIRRLSALGFDVHDRGDVVPQILPNLRETAQLRHLGAIAGWARTLSDSTYSALNANALPIIVGGDHSVSFGSVNGVARHHREQGTELFVLWLDAHADFNTPEITPTGNTHGMSAAFLCGEPGMEEIIGGGERYSIAPRNLYLFGTRWIDPDEQLLLGKRGVNVFDMRTIDKIGVPALLGGIVDHVKSRRGALHVSFDLDFLDPGIAPGVGTPEPGGVSYREAHLVMEILHDCGLVASIDLVELNPLLDDRNKSAHLFVELLTSLLGRKIMDLRENSATRGALAVARYGH
jgi:arginase